MLLGIKTDNPICEMYLYDNNGTSVATKIWQADRQLAHFLLKKLDEFLVDNKSSFDEISGLFVFKGPGSFTGLRIGVTVMNTIAYSQDISIVGVEGEGWLDLAISRLLAKENDQVVMPEYGAEARITKPRK